jgi:outer membrane receptor protein involved in Fe transport
MDQRHTINVYGGYRVSPSVNVSVKWLYGSGLPLPGFYKKVGTTYFLLDQRNALRLDPYQRTDARINKVWPRDKWKITLYGEVMNLTNRTNYRFDSFDNYNNRTGQVSITLNKMFPILPAAGVVIER